MSSLVVASTAADAHAVDAIRSSHAELVGAVRARTSALLVAISRGSLEDAVEARDTVVRYGEQHLVPRLRIEADTLLGPARADDRARLLVDALAGEQRTIAQLVTGVAEAETPLEAAASARSLEVLVVSHVAKCDEQLLPALAESSAASMADAHAALRFGLDTLPQPDDVPSARAAGGCGGGVACGCGGDDGDGDAAEPAAEAQIEQAAAGGGCGGGSCGCGGSDDVVPELDARTVPHAVRHATIFGALDTVPSGGAMVLVAPHDPVPLLGQLEQREPGAFSVDYLERGPDAWRLKFTRA